MAEGGGEEASRASLQYTPTWVVAGVCSVIVLISLLAERLLHRIGKFLKHKHQDALFEALQKLKEELMLLGFISLLLTVFQGLISHICIPENITNNFLPCNKQSTKPESGTTQHLLGLPSLNFERGRRHLLAAEVSDHCARLGKAPLLSLEALHQLHIFIFVLAVVHVVFCATTMFLGGARISQWKHWEISMKNERAKETQAATSTETQKEKAKDGSSSHRTFILERTKGFWGKSIVISWLMSFFKQFYGSITHSDYAALRSGFVMTHCRSNPEFDFHKYMMRTLESDFKRVVGISWYLWLFVVVFLFLNVDGWHTYFWLAFLPLILLLVVGAKLEHIITKMAQDVEDKQTKEGEQSVTLSNDHFWFSSPGLVLYLIHFILFQNSFEIAFFFWIWSTYGFKSCIMEDIGYIIPRLIIGVIIQVLCSYSTLPLYALVTQMGSMFKKEIFHDQFQAHFQSWIEGARERRRRDEKKLVQGPSSMIQMRSMSGDEILVENGDQCSIDLEGKPINHQ